MRQYSIAVAIAFISCYLGKPTPVLSHIEPSAQTSVPDRSTNQQTQWPVRDVAMFIFDRLDLSTFRNSTGPRREPQQRTFRDLGILPTRVTDTHIVSEDNNWYYEVEILGQRDFNGDGVEEVAICFRDEAKRGSYRTQSPLLLQLIGHRVVALHFAIDMSQEAASCPNQT